jgi:hypothetical protein
MFRTVTVDFSVGPNGLSVKNSTRETAGFSRITRIAVATSLRWSGYPLARSSERPVRRRRAASAPGPSPMTAISLPRDWRRTWKASSIERRFSSAIPKSAVRSASGSATAG